MSSHIPVPAPEKYFVAFVIQGDDDRNVQFSQTVQLAEALRKQKVSVEELVFPDEIHDLLLWKSWVTGYKAGAEFFGRKLGPSR